MSTLYHAAIAGAGLFLAAGFAHATCPPSVGDANGDGVVDVTDAQCAIQVALSYALGETLPPCVVLPGGDGYSCEGDANCSGTLTVADVLLTIFSILGQPLPPELDANADGCVDACAAPPDSPRGQCGWLGGVDAPCMIDGWDESNGCTLTFVTNGVACADGDACTNPDQCQSGCCTSTFDWMQPNCSPFDFTTYCTISGEQGEHVSCALSVARLEGSPPASAIQGVFHWDPGELALLDLLVLVEIVGVGEFAVSYVQFPGAISVAPTPVSEASGSFAMVIASQPDSNELTAASVEPDILLPVPFPSCAPRVAGPGDIAGNPFVLWMEFELLSDLPPEAPAKVAVNNVLAADSASIPLEVHVLENLLVTSQ